MIHAIYYLGSGFTAGFLSSFSIGPTTLWLAQAKLPPKKPQLNINLFLLSVIFMDVGYAALTFWGQHYLQQEVNTTILIQRILGAAIAILGFFDLKDAFNNKITDKLTTKQKTNFTSAGKDFTIGALYGANPAFILYWLFCAQILSRFGLDQLTGFMGILFCFGILVADLFLYITYLKLLDKGLSFIPHKFVKIIKASIGTMLIGFGLFLIAGG